MVAIARGQENTQSILNWYITVNGVLTDAYEIGYQICDVTGGYPGTQIFPALLGAYEDVTLPPGRFSAGSYFAYDNANTTGWTPSLGEPLGTHCIKWQWKISAAAPYQSGQEEFEVLPQSIGSTADLYVTLAEIRDLGITVLQASDAEVIAAITLAQALFERATRQWFVPRAYQFKFDGTSSDAAHFAIPIISIDWLKINDATVNLDTYLYRVYSGRSMPDDRKNPRIKLIGPSGAGYDLFSAANSVGKMIFRKGRQNQEVKGVFGYVEDDGSIPAPVKEAVKRMTVERLARPAAIDPLAPPIAVPPMTPGGAVVEEETDGHRIRYAAATTSNRRYGLSGITSDMFAQDVIKLYMAPRGIAVASDWAPAGY